MRDHPRLGCVPGTAKKIRTSNWRSPPRENFETPRHHPPSYALTACITSLRFARRSTHWTPKRRLSAAATPIPISAQRIACPKFALSCAPTSFVSPRLICGPSNSRNSRRNRRSPNRAEAMIIRGTVATRIHSNGNHEQSILAVWLFRRGQNHPGLAPARWPGRPAESFRWVPGIGAPLN